MNRIEKQPVNQKNVQVKSFSGMKRILVVLTVFVCTATIFAACNKEEDEVNAVTINATVEEGASYATSIDDVKAVIADGDSILFVVASGNYTNGGFSLTLPKSIDGKYLSAMDTDMPEGIKISDSKVKGCSVGFNGYKSGEIVGMFQNGKIEDEMFTATESYLFVDGNIKISGSSTETSDLMGTPITLKTNYDLTLKKGWNLAYLNITITVTETEIIMTLDISNTQLSGLKWYFTEGDNSSLSIQKKMVELSKLKTQMLF
jgi:hypothetical protein